MVLGSGSRRTPGLGWAGAWAHWALGREAESMQFSRQSCCLRPVNHSRSQSSGSTRDASMTLNSKRASCSRSAAINCSRVGAVVLQIQMLRSSYKERLWGMICASVNTTIYRARLPSRHSTIKPPPGMRSVLPNVAHPFRTVRKVAKPPAKWLRPSSALGRRVKSSHYLSSNVFRRKVAMAPARFTLSSA